jgi:hypothetical protein
MMLATLCVVAAFLALFGSPSVATISAGSAGTVFGFVTAWIMVPRKDLGLTAGSLLTGLVIAGLITGGPRSLSVFDPHSSGGSLVFGLYFGFWVVALPRLTKPAADGPIGEGS